MDSSDFNKVILSSDEKAIREFLMGYIQTQIYPSKNLFKNREDELKWLANQLKSCWKPLYGNHPTEAGIIKGYKFSLADLTDLKRYVMSALTDKEILKLAIDDKINLGVDCSGNITYEPISSSPKHSGESDDPTFLL